MKTDFVIHRLLRRPYRLHVASDTHPGRTPTLVFIHGLGSSSRMWEYVLKKINIPVRVITLDMLGFGSSPKPQWKVYSAKTHAIALHKTLQQLKVNKDVILVGHSLGGLVTIEYARRHPKIVSRLILCSPPLYLSIKKVSSYIRTRDDMYRSFYKWLRNDPRLLLYLSNKQTLNKENLPTYLKNLEESIENQNSLKTLQKITCPVDILYGRLDPLIIRKNYKLVAKTNSNIRLHPVTGGHMPSLLYQKRLVSLINKITYPATSRPR